MKVAIAIFVKTPGLSPLKTRLAASIGKDKAEAFYKLSLKSISSTLKASQQVSDITPYWAVGEVEGMNNPLWHDFNKLHTGEGDLGERQSHVYNTLLTQYEAVILIGGDAPQLSVNHVEDTIRHLTLHDYVIGPADDGGYYLLAGRKKIDDHVWAGTPWSHDDTKQILVSKLDSQPYQLHSLTDVDTESDLESMLAEMPKSTNKDQENLKNWIKLL